MCQPIRSDFITWPGQQENIGERPHQQSVSLGLELQLVNHIVEVSEVLQLPDTRGSHSPGQCDQEVSSTVGEVGDGGVLHHGDDVLDDVAGEVGAEPGVGAVLETLGVERGEPVTPGLQ